GLLSATGFLSSLPAASSVAGNPIIAASTSTVARLNRIFFMWTPVVKTSDWKNSPGLRGPDSPANSLALAYHSAPQLARYSRASMRTPAGCRKAKQLWRAHYIACHIRSVLGMNYKALIRGAYRTPASLLRQSSSVTKWPRTKSTPRAEPCGGRRVRDALEVASSQIWRLPVRTRTALSLVQKGVCWRASTRVASWLRA